jgi:hypothetical protein
MTDKQRGACCSVEEIRPNPYVSLDDAQHSNVAYIVKGYPTHQKRGSTCICTK